jgi:hypothetical protein
MFDQNDAHIEKPWARGEQILKSEEELEKFKSFLLTGPVILSSTRTVHRGESEQTYGDRGGQLIIIAQCTNIVEGYSPSNAYTSSNKYPNRGNKWSSTVAGGIVNADKLCWHCFSSELSNWSLSNVILDWDPALFEITHELARTKRQI